MRGVAFAAIVAAAATRWWACTGRADRVPVVTVARESFVRRVTTDGYLRAVKATPVVVPRVQGARKIAWLAPDGSVVAAGDIVVRFDPSDAEHRLHEAQIDLESAEAKLSEEQIKSASGIAGRTAAAALAARVAEQTRRFAAADPLIFSRVQIAESEIDVTVAAARQAQAEQAVGIDSRLLRSNVQLIAIGRDKAKLAVDRANTALASMVMRAPGDGILVFRRDDKGDLPKLGASVWSDQTLADIPKLDDMEADLFVLEVDGGGIEAGQPADVVVESRPDTVFHGKVRLVDKLAKRRNAFVPVQYFGAVVALDTTDRAAMKPGQRVRATLVVDKQDALVVPRQAVFEQAGRTIVYRRDDRGFSPVPVELGAATAGRVVITAGLAEGDVIAQRDPMHALEPSDGSSAEAAP